MLEGAKIGLSQADVYLASGYSTTQRAAEVNASKLLSHAEIQQRIAELGAPAIKKTQVTVESLLTELEANITRATALGQTGAVNGAIGLMAKLRGLLIDRAEIGRPGDFDGLETREDVVDALLAGMYTSRGADHVGRTTGRDRGAGS